MKRQETLNSMGYDHEVVVDLEEVRRLSPHVADHVVGGLVCYTDGLANPMLTSKVYAEAAKREGVTILNKTRVIEATTTSSGFKVRTSSDKFYEGEMLVNCTGAWAGRFSEMLGDPLPVFSAAPTMMVTDRMPGILNGTSLIPPCLFHMISNIMSWFKRTSSRQQGHPFSPLFNRTQAILNPYLPGLVRISTSFLSTAYPANYTHIHVSLTVFLSTILFSAVFVLGFFIRQ